jgi:hypothetical protein
MVQSLGQRFAPSKETLWQLHHAYGSNVGEVVIEQEMTGVLEYTPGDQPQGFPLENLELSFNDYLKMHFAGNLTTPELESHERYQGSDYGYFTRET